MNAPKLCVYVMYHNRPEFIKECLDSIFLQDYPNLEVIVSDNSSNADSSIALNNYLINKKAKVIKRNPSLASIEHFSTVLEEAKTSPYFMLFHDDDVLLPSALSTLMAHFELDVSLGAVGCNAYRLEKHTKTKKLFIKSDKDLLVNTPKDLAELYLNYSPGHAPFPSYIYKSSALFHLTMNAKKGGKHSDVSFLLDVIENSRILMLSQPLMFYRTHGANDSQSHDLYSTLSLARILKTKQATQKNLNAFKFKSILKYYLQSRSINVNYRGWKRSILLKSALLFFIKNPLIVLCAIANKAKSIYS